MTRLQRACCLLLGALALPVAAQAPSPTRVLFIGNSYTYTNDLPEVVRRVAAAKGLTLTVRSLTAPGAAIEDHFSGGQPPRLLRTHWDVVVLQQGPSSLIDSRRHLVHWTREVRAAAPDAARIVMFSVWPARHNAHTWRAAEHSYAKAALHVDGCVAPAAAAWRLAIEDGLAAPLYSSDDLHPSQAGTLLAALSLVQALWGGSDPQPIGAVASEFPEGSWSAALAISAELDHYARLAVAGSPAPCLPADGS